jgi:transcriptional regulator with XRE-family HTH domain
LYINRDLIPDLHHWQSAGAMRTFSNQLTRIIRDSGLRLNTISKTSGISHTYLTKLVQGNINRPGKDKIASILLSLNFSIGDINKVVAEYDYQPLNRLDIPEILKNNRKRKIEGSLLPSYDHVYFDLLLSSIERMGGDKILVKDTPSSLYMPDELYLKREYPFTYEKDDQAEDFRCAFSHALLRERKGLFFDNCRSGHRFETYICKRCLDDYLKQKLGSVKLTRVTPDHRLTVRYFANALAAMLRNPDQHRTRLVERCAYYVLQLQDIQGRHPIVFFLGKKPHDYDNVHEQRNLEGYTSDSPTLITLFQKEIDIFRRAVYPETDQDYPHRLVEYILIAFEAVGLRTELESAIGELTGRTEPGFYEVV